MTLLIATIRSQDALVTADGRCTIPGVSFKEIQDVSVEKVRAYHKSLMDAAIAADMKDNPVGGHVHEIRITADRCTWTIPP